jgi:hypothetical protein
MGDKFTALKFQWLEGIAADIELPASATRLAAALNKHLNRKTWDAFPAVATLARAIGMTERRVQGLLQDLVNHGHLTIETGGGRHATNRYRPVFEDADSCAPSLDQKRWAKSSNSVSSAGRRNPEGHFGVSSRKTQKLAASKPRNQVHPNPYIEPCTPKVPTDASCDDAHSAWRAFELAWRFDMSDRRAAARREFENLSAADQRLAIEQAPFYLRRCASGAKRCRASRWLREKLFQDAAVSQSEPRPQRSLSEAIPTDRGFFIRISSPQWREWSRVEGPLPTLNTEFGIGCFRPSEWPIGMDASAEPFLATTERSP